MLPAWTAFVHGLAFVFHERMICASFASGGLFIDSSLLSADSIIAGIASECYTRGTKTRSTGLDRNWLLQYPPGVPADIDPDSYPSLREIFEQACSTHGHSPAFTNMGATLSYAQLDTLSRAFAAWLQKKSGLTQGDRVALMMPNILQYPIALFGVLRAGMVVVNNNPLYTPREDRKS